jgi:hypothetical protein
MTDDEAPTGTGLLNFAGLALAFAGTALAVSAVQLEVMFEFYENWIALWVYLQGALGVGALVTGFSYGRAPGWTLKAAPAFGISCTVVGVGWLVFAFLHGLFTMISLLAVALSAGATIAVLVAWRTARQLHRARIALGGE